MADSHIIKDCKKCLRALSASEFNSHKRSRDHLRPECKACEADYQRAYREKNREKLNSYLRDYYQKNKEHLDERNKAYNEAHREELAEYQRAYHLANPEKKRKTAHDYYHANKEKVAEKQRQRRPLIREREAEYSRRWRERNPEARKASLAANKAKRKAAPGSCSAAQWKAKCEYWGWRCYLCGVEVTPQTVHLEHRIPLSRGGSHWAANVAPSCAPCNLSKSVKTESEYRKSL